MVNLFESRPFPAPVFFFAVFFEWVRNSKPTKASFFQKWLRERLLRYFSFQAIFEDGASEQFFCHGFRSQKCWEWTTQMIFLPGLNIHIFIQLMVQKSGERSPPAYEAFIHIINRINYQAQLTSRISEPSTCQGFSQCISYANPPKKDVFF